MGACGNTFSITCDVPQLPTESVELGIVLGHGGYSCVYKGTYQGSVVAVKQMSIPLLIPGNDVEKIVQNELKLLARLRDCDSVVQVLGYMHAYPCLSIVLSFCRERPAFAWVSPKRWNMCMPKANILLDRFLTPKLTDFGVSKSFSSLSRGSQLGGTLRYIAPERIRHYNKKFTREESMLSDIFGYGLITWELVTDGELPYASLEDDMAIKLAKLDNEKQFEHLGEVPRGVPDVFQDIVRLSVSEPSLRPSLASAQNAFGVFIACSAQLRNWRMFFHSTRTASSAQLRNIRAFFNGLKMPIKPSQSVRLLGPRPDSNTPPQIYNLSPDSSLSLPFSKPDLN
ncbi:kinase-like domain-containing protein [Jimgerdemannia flammicorona]|uniref:Kinase-like domain-containing protein n=1 Tax=Jimgerdemannia flammicorona TaxID=994334 RepID=A0A433BJF9_9FUNG|nr:kinase-like domain-containing protein [Jimgerdemannia flammicorona]